MADLQQPDTSACPFGKPAFTNLRTEVWNDLVRPGKVPPISEQGNVIEIAALFGGPEKLRESVNVLQALLYAA